MVSQNAATAHQLSHSMPDATAPSFVLPIAPLGYTKPKSNLPPIVAAPFSVSKPGKVPKGKNFMDPFGGANPLNKAATTMIHEIPNTSLDNERAKGLNGAAPKLDPDGAVTRLANGDEPSIGDFYDDKTMNQKAKHMVTNSKENLELPREISVLTAQLQKASLIMNSDDPQEAAARIAKEEEKKFDEQHHVVEESGHSSNEERKESESEESSEESSHSQSKHGSSQGTATTSKKAMPKGNNLITKLLNRIGV